MEREGRGADYFAAVGITLDFIGWADTFTFDQAVQDAVNRRYIATPGSGDPQAVLAPMRTTIQGLAGAEALRAFGQKTGWQVANDKIVGLPAELGPLMSTLLRAAPTGQAAAGQAAPASAAPASAAPAR